MPERFQPWSPYASLAAGVLWLLVWLHQRSTHGPTPVNEMRLLLGLTWMDSAKLLSLPPLLLLPGVLSLHQQREDRTWLGRVGVTVTATGLGCLSIATAIEFWPFPWGSYAVKFEDAALPQVGGMIQALSSFILTLGFIGFNVDLVRAKLMPAWTALALVVGALSTSFLTPAGWFPGFAWVLFGALLWLRRVIRSPGPA